ncbi:MAG: MFS transporter [Actinomycetota bacterium]
MTSQAATTSPPEANPKRYWILAVLCLSLLIVVVGNTVVNVTLPRLVEDLGATSTQLQWVVAAYALVFAGLLLTAGALGDRYGRKGALTIGLLIFGAASLGAMFAGSPVALITARAVMGLGGALIMPATLSILVTVFPPQERAKAIATWAGVAGAGAAIGPVTGGWLLQHFYWGSVFSINLPLVVITLVAGRFLVPDSRDPRQTPLDPVGAGLSIVGLTALLYAIIEAPVYGWGDSLIVASFAVAVVVLLAFGWWELHTTDPMLDLRFFKNRTFSGGALAITLNFFALFGAFFMLTQYLQFVHGYTPLQAGVRTLPMAAVMMIVAPRSAGFAARFGTKRTVGAGLSVVALGLFLFSRMEINTGYSFIALALVVTAFGMGLTMPPATASIMSGVPLAKAGVGSAMNDTTRELGGALGVAVIGSLLSSHYTSAIAPAVKGLSPKLQEVAQSSVGGALAVAGKVGGAAGQALVTAAKTAFVDGMQEALLVAAVIALVASALALWLLPAEVHHGRADGHGLPQSPDGQAATSNVDLTRPEGLPSEGERAHAGSIDLDTA